MLGLRKQTQKQLEYEGLGRESPDADTSRG